MLQVRGFRALLVQALTLPLMLAAVVAGMLVWQVNQLVQASRAVEGADALISQTRKTRRILFDTATDLRGYLISGDANYRAAHLQGMKGFRREMDELARLVSADPGLAVDVRGIRSVAAQWETDAQQLAALRSRGADYLSHFRAGYSEADLDTLRARYESLIADEEARRDGLQRGARAASRRTLGAVLALMVGFGLFVGIVTRRQLVQLSHSYREAVAELHASRESLATTLMCIGDGVLATDPQGRVSLLNPVAARLTGWTEERARGRPAHEVFRIVNELTRAEVESPVDRVIRDGVVVGLANHTLLLRADGTEIAIDDSGAPIRNARGELAGVVLVFRDVTARRAVEKALARSEARYRAIGDTIPYGVWEAAVDGGFTYLSRSFLQLVGRTMEECRGDGWVDCLHPADARPVLKDWQRCAVEEPYWDRELRVRGIDGRYHTILARGVPVHDDDGRRTGWVGLHLDITARKEQEAEIEDLNARLQRAMAESHHRIKNNLQLVTALLDIHEPGATDLESAAALRRVSQHVRALATIHDLLTQEVRAGSQGETVPVRAATQKLLPLLEQALDGRAVEHSVDDIRLPVRQVTSLALLVNELVSNASKHGRGTVRLQLCAGRGEARLEVSDDGPGFPAGFNPRTSANTGIELIESLGRWDLQGDIAYSNRPDGGACVAITFPIPPTDEAPGAARPAGAVPGPAGGTR